MLLTEQQVAPRKWLPDTCPSASQQGPGPPGEGSGTLGICQTLQEIQCQFGCPWAAAPILAFMALWSEGRIYPRGYEVRGKEVEQAFSNCRLQSTKGHEMYLMGQDQNRISFCLWLPPLLFLKRNCPHALLGPPPTMHLAQALCLLRDLPQLCVLLSLSTCFSLSTGPFT